MLLKIKKFINSFFYYFFMKILAAADIHGDLSLVEKLVEKAKREDVDSIILAGDLFKNNQEPFDIVGKFSSLKKPVFLIPGNHEALSTVDFVAKIYGAVNLHGYAVKTDNIGFFGVSAVNIGPFLHDSEEKMEDLLKKSFEYIKDSEKKILVTHVPPSNVSFEKLSPFVSGSKIVEKIIKELQPDIAISGHIHEASGIEEKIGKTKIINVSRTGKIIEL